MLKSSSSILASILLVLLVCAANAFVSPRLQSQSASDFRIAAAAAEGENDPNDIVARRIIVEGDVQGGYYRSCVRNEAGRFRRLSGTMTPPDDSNTAEIYVEVCIYLSSTQKGRSAVVESALYCF